MSSENKPSYPSTRETLLSELEQIKQSLQFSEDGDSDEDLDIPVLTETLATSVGIPSEGYSQLELDEQELIAQLEAELESSAAAALPGQQSLFDERILIMEPAPSDLPAANGENPFLPAHIRERLNKNKNTVLEELANIGETLARSSNQYSSVKTKLADAAATEGNLSAEPNTASSSQSTNAERTTKAAPNDALIDELVAEFLPKIEAALRKKLKERFE